MKKTIIATVVLIFTVMSVSAQTEKGNMFAGLNIQYNRFSPETVGPSFSGYEKTTSIGFGPEFGYFVARNLVVGPDVYFGHFTSTNNLGEESKTTSWRPGLFARYYKYTSEGKFAFFAHLVAGIGRATSKQSDPSGTVETIGKDKSTYAQLSPGFAYFFNRHWGLDIAVTGLYFSQIKSTNDLGIWKSTTGGLNINSLSPNLAVRYYFGS